VSSHNIAAAATIAAKTFAPCTANCPAPAALVAAALAALLAALLTVEVTELKLADLAGTLVVLPVAVVELRVLVALLDAEDAQTAAVCVRVMPAGEQMPLAYLSVAGGGVVLAT
jgi:hypothetical protein